MRTRIPPFRNAIFALSAVLVSACGPADEHDFDMESEGDVATAAGALTDSQGIGAFFQNGTGTPSLSVGRGVGTIPNVCRAGETEILGLCFPGGWPASCPAGKELDPGGLCYDLCPLGYRGVGPVCWLDKLDYAACDALYNPTLAASALNSNRTLTFGIGASMAVGASVGFETGVYYGEDGSYGCYTSQCQGVVTDISVEMYGSFGNFNTVSNLTGDGFDLEASGGVGPLGYTQSLSFDGNGNVVGSVQQVSFGAGVVPISLGVSTCDTTLLEINGPGLAPNDADGYPGNTLYRIDPDGNLEMSHRATNGSFDMVYNEIGWGFGGSRAIFAAEGGHVYTITSDGTLRYYHHDAAGTFDGYSGVEIGWGFAGFTKVFAARFGEIYGIDKDGVLRIYRHDAALQFQDSNGTIIGTGWNLPQVFSGGHGALYVIDGNGDLLYYYHDEANNWILTAMKIGSGWGGFASVGSTGNGQIYAVTPAGDLLFYQHDVDKVFLAGSGAKVGWGWDFGSRGIIPAPY